MKLTDTPVNTSASVVSFSDNLNCDELKNLGICTNAKIEKIKNGHLIICSVCGCRLGLNRNLTDQIEVKIVEEE